MKQKTAISAKRIVDKIQETKGTINTVDAMRRDNSHFLVVKRGYHDHIIEAKVLTELLLNTIDSFYHEQLQKCESELEALEDK